jgi:hypothetical protein
MIMIARPGLSMFVLLVGQIVIDWLYMALVGPDAAEDSGPIGALVARIGWLIPKVSLYGQHFRAVGEEAFAEQLARIYGFSFLISAGAVFALTLAACFWWARLRRQLSQETISTSGAERKAQVARMGWAILILTAYYDFVGFGLGHGSVPFENENGAFVLGAAVVGFPWLCTILFYIAHSSLILRFAARRD